MIHQLIEKYRGQIEALEDRLKAETATATYTLLKASVGTLENVINDLVELQGECLREAANVELLATDESTEINAAYFDGCAQTYKHIV